MNFAVEQNGACVRPVAPQAVLLYAAPPELALQPERACMISTNVEIQRDLREISCVCYAIIIWFTLQGTASGTEPVEFHSNQGQEAAPLA